MAEATFNLTVFSESSWGTDRTECAWVDMTVEARHADRRGDKLELLSWSLPRWEPRELHDNPLRLCNATKKRAFTWLCINHHERVPGVGRIPKEISAMIVDWVIMTDTCRSDMVRRAWGSIAAPVRMPLPYVQQPESAWEQAAGELNERGIRVRRVPACPNRLFWHPDLYGGGLYRVYTDPYKDEDAAGVWPRVPLDMPNREFHVLARTPSARPRQCRRARIK